MPKVIISILILFLTLTAFPLSVSAQAGKNSTPSCLDPNFRYIVTVDASSNNLTDQSSIVLGTNRPLGVNVKIPKDTVNRNWQYFIVILSHPELSGERATTFNELIRGNNPNKPDEVIGGVAYSVFHWDIKQGLNPTGVPGKSEFTEYIVEVKHAEPGLFSFGADICLGPEKQIKTVSSALAEVGSCPITISENFNSSDQITGAVDLKSINGISYGYRLNEGDVSSQIPKEPLNPKPLIQIPGFHYLRPNQLSIQTNPLSPGTGIKLPPQTKDNGTYTATVYAETGGNVFACGSRVVRVSNSPTSTPTTGGGTIVPIGGGGGINSGSLSTQQGGVQTTAQGGGKECDPTAGAKGKGGIETAIGCIPTDPTALIGGLLRFSTAAGGGIALLLMIFGAFQYITSAGNPEALKKAQDQFTNAFIGLLFIIFSTLLLQIIGVDILNLPGFTR